MGSQRDQGEDEEEEGPGMSPGGDTAELPPKLTAGAALGGARGRAEQDFSSGGRQSRRKTKYNIIVTAVIIMIITQEPPGGVTARIGEGLFWEKQPSGRHGP